MARPDLWDDREKAENVSREKSSLEDELALYDRLETNLDDLGVLLELANEADDDETRREAIEKFVEMESILAVDQLGGRGHRRL